ncbi:hypothetical protein N779_16105 [Vibrio coralliilyticus OCN008]|nr:hypothetical protein N779_16105 [Vibrio coralliilyticus OCN008]
MDNFLIQVSMQVIIINIRPDSTYQKLLTSRDFILSGYLLTQSVNLVKTHIYYGN